MSLHLSQVALNVFDISVVHSLNMFYCEICKLLCDYIQVINMNEFIKPKMEEAKKKLLDQIKEEATENAVVAVRNKLKEQWEQEQQQKEAGQYNN